MAPLQRKKSSRLITTTPDSILNLEHIKSQISSKLFNGLEVLKVSSKGTLVPRILTLSDDLFTLFISHHKVGKAESFADRIQYKSFKAYSSVISTVTGMKVQNNHDIRVIDVADILWVQSGFIGSRKLESCSKATNLEPRKVISIFHNNTNSTDFQVYDGEDLTDLRSVLSAIRTIREAYQSAKLKVGREELLLRYSWYDTGKFAFVLFLNLVQYEVSTRLFDLFDLNLPLFDCLCKPHECTNRSYTISFYFHEQIGIRVELSIKESFCNYWAE